MAAADALVVDAAALERGLVRDAVVAEIAEGLGDRRQAHPQADLFDLDLMAALLLLRDLEVVVDGALANAVLVEPADPPLATHANGFAHGLLLLPRASPLLIFTLPSGREDRVRSS